MTEPAATSPNTGELAVVIADDPPPQLASPPSPLRAPPKLSVSWHNVGFSVKLTTPGTKEKVDKTILQGVSGVARPGELLVLMGPSGAGKSTLLDCISARNRSCTGSILVNGQPWSKRAAKHACYVMQDDLFYANLTVQEHLTFQAQLRMGRFTPTQDREKRVAQIVSELGLGKVLTTPIGDAQVKGLSGGQRKRLSFATELLTNPSLLFVDEPTSGLDSFMAEIVVRQMRELAHCGRTVIATIHQPASDLFELFDTLYLLVDGCTVYNGAASESIAYFARQGFQCPSFMNPTDYFMKQLVVTDGDLSSKARVQKLTVAWQDSNAKNAMDSQDDKLAAASEALSPVKTDTTTPTSQQSPSPPPSPVRKGGARTWVEADESEEDLVRDAPSVFTLILVLCRRNMLRLVRDTVGFKARIGSSLFITLLIGLVFLQLGNDQKGVQDFTGAIFFVAVNQCFSSANAQFVTVPLEVPLVLREHNGGIFNILIWYLALNITETPFHIFLTILAITPCYFMVGFKADAEMYFSFLLILSLLTMAASGLGYMVSCMTKRVDLAPIVGILFLMPSILFGGLFLNSDSTPDYFIWLQATSPLKYGFHAMMRAYWSQIDHISCAADDGERCVYNSGADVLSFNSIDTGRGRMLFDCIIICVLSIAFRLIGAVFLWRRTERKGLVA